MIVVGNSLAKRWPAYGHRHVSQNGNFRGERRRVLLLCKSQGGREKGVTRRTDDNDTLSSLDALLGAEKGKEEKKEPELVEWWRIKPKQDAAPRQNALAPGPQGRFVMSEDFLRMNELRVGQKTRVGSQLDTSQVQPVLSYALLLSTISCYGTYLNICSLQNFEAGREFISGISSSIEELASSGANATFFHCLTSCILVPGPFELALAAWSLLFLAPSVEATLGYPAFLAIFLLSGASGSTMHLMMQRWADVSEWNQTSCSLPASLLGVLAALVINHLSFLKLQRSAEELAAADAQGTSRVESPVKGVRAEKTGVSGSGSPATANGMSSSSVSGMASLLPERAVLLSFVGVLVSSLILATTRTPGQISGVSPLGLVPILTGFVSGGVLTTVMGPEFCLQREPEIPEGSMIIPEDAPEMLVVMDRSSGVKKIIAGTSCFGLLWSILGLIANFTPVLSQ